MANRPLSAVRGMHDLLPRETVAWSHIEARLRTVLRQYAFNEIRVPLVESAALFSHTVGAATDIVTKEMYRFTDLNGESLCLRPEGTAGVARAAMQHGLAHNQVQRLWYLGPMFRHERPQKGRYRQFHQLGVEVYGLDGPDIDAELLLMCARLWEELGSENQGGLGLKLEINSLGDRETRQAYRKILVDYFQAHRNALDDESLTRLAQNPLRLLDSKDSELQQLIHQAPSMLDCLDSCSKDHFDALCELLDKAGLAYQVNPRLVRGLDYYEKTVFEWLAPEGKGTAAVCAGGRYDKLFESLGARATPAIGFALGMERLLNHLPKHCLPVAQEPDIYFICADMASSLSLASMALSLCDMLRRELPERMLLQHLGGGSFKKQFRRADQSGAHIALILGEEEASQKSLTIKFLRTDRPQQTLPIHKVSAFLQQLPWD
ncbi:MAG: histidine--tRNA ligase [Candidatus Eutrophobiaceae bacterium]